MAEVLPHPPSGRDAREDAVIVVPEDILAVVHHYARVHGVDSNLILAIAQVESSMNPHAKGDYDREGRPHSFGLMQLHTEGAGFGHTPEELLDLDNNVNWGTAYLRGCIDAFPGDIYTAISAYNQGIGGARSRGWGLNAPYVRAVLRWRDAFRGERPEPIPPLPAPPGCWTATGVIGLGLGVTLWKLLEVLR